MPVEGEVLYRGERGHPRPILEDPPLLQGALEQTGVEDTEPGEESEVMGSLDDVDRVDLEDVQRADGAGDVTEVRGGAGAGRGQALGSDGNASGL
jgi:hypothetical protein